MVQMPKCLYGLDDRINADPTVVDFHRKPSEIKHAAFGSGPHICPGNVPARRELIIFLEEWPPEIRDFDALGRASSRASGGQSGKFCEGRVTLQKKTNIL